MSKKGVMLSQNGGSGIGGSKATLGSGGPSIGNYKGVMLCNRPSKESSIMLSSSAFRFF